MRPALSGLALALMLACLWPAAASATDPCTPGTYSASGEGPGCIPAESGYYVSLPGQEQATPCPAGTFSANPGAWLCELTPAGHFSGTAATAPTPCPAGTYDPNEQSSSIAACVPDLPGTWSAGGAERATRCVPGTFAPDTDSLSCSEARPGYYVSAYGATSELPCLPGSFSAAPASTECELVPPGTYSGEAATEPIPCRPGTEAPEPGQAACTAVDAGPATGAGVGSSVTATSAAASPTSTAHGRSAVTFRIEQARRLPGGRIRLLLQAATPGRFTAVARVSAPLAPAPKRRAPGATHTYARGDVSALGGTTSLTISPSRHAAQLLRGSTRVHLTVAVIFAPDGGSAPVTRDVAVAVR